MMKNKKLKKINKKQTIIKRMMINKNKQKMIDLI